MQRLRDPRDGCPWDLAQDYASIVPSTLEEAYEVADTIERGEYDELRGELGDLLFQAVFYSQLAHEEGRFDLHQVIDELVRKLVSRHPHVFPDGSLQSRRDSETGTDTVTAKWEAIKQDERKARGHASVLDDIPMQLPALSRAQKLQKRAASLGFDWKEAALVLRVIHEELDELEREITEADQKGQAEELGDLIFSCVNLARKLGFDAEQCLRQSGSKFEKRFRQVELLADQQGQPIGQASGEQLDLWWNLAKTKTTKD